MFPEARMCCSCKRIYPDNTYFDDEKNKCKPCEKRKPVKRLKKKRILQLKLDDIVIGNIEI